MPSGGVGLHVPTSTIDKVMSAGGVGLHVPTFTIDKVMSEGGVSLHVPTSTIDQVMSAGGVGMHVPTSTIDQGGAGERGWFVCADEWGLLAHADFCCECSQGEKPLVSDKIPPHSNQPGCVF